MFHTTKTLFQTILLAILLLPSAAAQESPAARQTDSILAMLPQLHGTEKLDALYEFIDTSNDVMASKPFLDMLLAEARRQDNIEMEGAALGQLVYYYTFRFDNDSIFTVADDAITFLRRHELYDFLHKVIHNVILRHTIDGRFLTAMRMAEDHYEELKELQNDWLMAEMLSTIASLYDDMGQAEEALRMYEMSLKLAKKNVETDRMDNFLLNTYYMMSLSAIDLKRYEDALLYIDSVQMVMENMQRNQPEINLLEEKSLSYSALVQIYAETKRYEDALMALRQLEKMYNPEWDGTIFEMLLIESYCHYYYETGNYEKALEYLNLLIQFFEGETNVASNYNFFKVRLLFKMGDYRQATQIAIHVIEQRDTLNMQRFATQINELRTIYELDRAELENERQRAKIRQQRIIIIASLGGCMLLAVIVACVVWNRKRIAQKNIALYRRIKEQDKAVEKYEALEKENKLLKARIQTDDEKTALDDEKTQHQLLFDRLREYLLTDRNFANDTMSSANKLKEQLGTNKDYLYEAIKEVTGKTLLAYINDMRLEEAKKLLDDTDKKIEEIAQMCGYEVQSTFNRRFKAHFGITPSDYRNSGKIVGSR